MNFKKLLLLFILLLTLHTFKTNAQPIIGFEIGVTYNTLKFESNNSNIVTNSKQGYIISTNIAYKFNKILVLETSPGIIQKKYSIKNKSNIYQNVNNTYIQCPVSIKYEVDFTNRLKTSISLGGYYAYWLISNINGLMPNVFEFSSDRVNNEAIKLESIRYNYPLNSEQDKRGELGWVVKTGIEYKIYKNFSYLLKGHYYKSTTSQKIESQQPRYNETFTFSTGISYYFN